MTLADYSVSERVAAVAPLSGTTFSIDEMSAFLDEHPAWNAQVLRCLSAGWALPHDMRFLLPVLGAAEEARRECCRILAARLGDPANARLSAASERDADAGLLRTWQRELQNTSESASTRLPTFALYFTQQCVNFCQSKEIPETTAFLLALETASMRVGTALREAREKASSDSISTSESASREALATIGELLVTSAQGNASYVNCQHAADQALSLYQRFFEDMHQGMRHHRLSTLSSRIQSRISLENEKEPAIAMFPGVGEIMCEEQDEKRGIEFTVERYPCTAEVLDPRVVRIPPGKTNNRHKHAHETLFYFIEGTGRILIGETWVPVKPGDAVFAPRWAIHQTHNTGSRELVLLAITDYYLTSTVYVGKYDKI